MAKRGEWLLNGSTILVTICVVVVTGMRVQAEYFKADPLKPTKVDDWRKYGAEGQRIGPSGSAVTIVEFADFQCVYCQRVAPELKRIQNRYPGKVAIVFRYFPLPGNEFALPATRAAECAAGFVAFEAFHDQVFAQADSIGKKPWTRFASDAGVVDLAGFEQCIDDTSSIPALDRDRGAAEELGVRGTPTFLINDLLISGYPGEDQLEKVVRTALKRAR